MRPLLLLAAAFVTLVAPHARGQVPAGTSAIDLSRSLVAFTVTKLGYADVDARFTDFDGRVVYDPQRPERSAVRWQVRVASMVSAEPNRDRAVQGPAYFDATRHPELTFESRQVRALDAGRLEVVGEITIKGRTRPLTIVASPLAGGLPGFETSFELDRYEFGVDGGGFLRWVIGRRVQVRLVAILEDTISGGTR